MTTEENKGFLLIEVLVTIVVISVSIIFINRAFTSSLKSAGLTHDFLSATLALEEKMFDLEINPQTETGESSGEIEFLKKRFHWKQEILPMELEEGLDYEYAEEDLGLEELKVSLTWKRQNVERAIEILTYIPIQEIEE